MGDKAILTEVLEASRLTDTYSSLTASNLIDQLKSGTSSHLHVHYEGIDGSDGIASGDQVRIGEPVDATSISYTSSGGADLQQQQGTIGSGFGGGGVPDVFTVDDAVEYLGFGRFQLLLALLTGLAWMADAMEIMILSILSPALHCEWGIQPMQQALITTCVFSGMMLSATLWGKCCDRFGRRRGLLCAALLTFAMGILSSAAPNFGVFLLLRALTGVGIGGIPQSVTLFAEFLPLAQRAKCVVLIEAFWAVGAAFEALLALVVMSSGWGWRWLLLLSSLPLAFFSLACLWLPESARFLMSAGRPECALQSLQRVARLNGRPLPSGKLIEASVQSKVGSAAPAEGGSAKSNGKRAAARGKLAHLFVPELRPTTLLLWWIWAVNAFCYYGVVLLTTVLFQSGDECHGGIAPPVPSPSPTSGTLSSSSNTSAAAAATIITNQLQMIMASANGTAAAGIEHELMPTTTIAIAMLAPTCKPLVQKDYLDLLSTTLSEFPGLVLTAVVIEWLGRKRTMAMEFGVFSLFLFLMAFCVQRHLLTMFIFIARAFISGAFQCVYVYTPEVYPTTLRAIGLGASSSMARLGAIATPFVAQVASGHSLLIPIGMYSATALLGLIAALALPIETKGRQMRETH